MKEGEDGEERELERSMQFVNVEVKVLTAMMMKFPTFGHMTLQRLVCRYKCCRKARHLIFKDTILCNSLKNEAASCFEMSVLFLKTS